jgi:5-(carboxyamino)imidazole ribonucleotide mutase
MKYVFRPPGLLFFFIILRNHFAQAAQKCGIGYQLGAPAMVGVSVFGGIAQHNFGPVFANGIDDRPLVRFIVLKKTIGQSQVLPHGYAHECRGSGRLGITGFYRTAGTHFAFGEVNDAHLFAIGDFGHERARTGQFNIIGVGAKGQYIQFHETKIGNAIDCPGNLPPPQAWFFSIRWLYDIFAQTFIMSNPLAGIIMGSDSDLTIMQAAADMLKQFDIPHEVTVVSAHRTPERMMEYAKQAAGRGLKVIIAGAGGAAHLPGMVAAITPLPVIGVPVKSSNSIDGWDSVLSILQMPNGVPVATVALNAAKNAGILAAQIIGTADAGVAQKVAAYKTSLNDEVLEKVARMKQAGWENKFD